MRNFVGLTELFQILTRAFNFLKSFSRCLVAPLVRYVVSKIFPEYTNRGPFSGVKPTPLTIIQRYIIDLSKKDVSVEFFPSDAFGDVQARRTNNGHQVSGAIRDAARKSISAAVTSAGLEVFELSPARQSIRSDNNCVSHAAPSDLQFDYDDPLPKEGSVIVCIDTDYYATERYFERILQNNNVMLLFTFLPRNLCGQDGDCSFRTDKGVITYEVSGGGCWVHRVWDWDGFGEYISFLVDTNTILGRFARALGLVKKAVYKIVVHRPYKDAPDRAIVLCLPQFNYWVHGMVDDPVNSRPLTRRDTLDKLRPGYDSLVTLEDGQPTFKAARSGSDYQFVIPKRWIDVLIGLANAGAVTTRLLSFGLKDKVALAAINQYVAAKEAALPDPPRLGNPAEVRPLVHWPVASYTDEPTTSARCYAPAIVSDCNMVPNIKRWEDTTLAISRRITEIHNTKVMPVDMHAYADEFLTLVIGDTPRLFPYSLEEVADMLDKPKQQLMLKQIWCQLDVKARGQIEAFIKNEPTMKAPRIISSFADFKLIVQLSAYTLMARDTILHAEHNRHWFIPGLTPPEIAEKLVEYVSGIQDPVEGDYKTMDGTVSKDLQRFVMHAFMYRAFHRDTHRPLRQLLNHLLNSDGVAKSFGFKYQTGFGVKSGSPTTCDHNTILNAYLQYVAVRRTNKNLTHDEAFRSIGMCFGDDSVFRSDYAKQWQIAAKRVGMTLKVEAYKPEQGLCFLGRVFLDPDTTVASMAEPLRAMRKLHITMRNPTVPLAEAAIDRMEGYKVTDSATPVIREYCQAVIDFYKPKVDDAARLSRSDRLKELPYWATADGSWPQDPDQEERMLDIIAARTGVEVNEWQDYINMILSTPHPWDWEPINRGLEQYEWKDTIAPCGFPSQSVDDRKYQLDLTQIDNDAVKQYERKESPREACGQDVGDGGGDPGCAGGGSEESSGQHREGSGKPDVLLPETGQDHGKRHGVFPREAKRGGLVRGGGRGRRQQPSKGGQTSGSRGSQHGRAGPSPRGKQDFRGGRGRGSIVRGRPDRQQLSRETTAAN
uniref:RNA replicase n=1 Tax=Beihai noda-like virus 24 TaxID=1922478 RepID=A0A1L3KFG3_9VIRU|nr:hypothetical protein [Beihai noda-like virus 24]